MRHCATPPTLDAAQQDRLFRFAAQLRQELAGSGARLALVARAGTDLRRFGHRYSHAGISLQDSPNTPWSVRQLYYDCDTARPRLFDQGLPGFVLGGASPDQGHVVLWLLPAQAAAPLEQVAQDERQALRLLGDSYSANAHAWSIRHQNCNQWVAELLALAWSGPAGVAGAADARSAAQQWLQAQGYVPTRVTVDNPVLLLAAAVVPWLRIDDHPPGVLQRAQFDTSLPAAIEAFVQRQVPGTRRIELCHDRTQIVVRTGWHPLGEGCRPEAGDRVIRFDTAPEAAAGA